MEKFSAKFVTFFVSIILARLLEPSAWITVQWRPKLIFSWTRLKGLLSYGWKLLIAKLVNTTYMKMRDLLIGKIYSTSDLAFFNKGDTFPAVIVPNITASVDAVMFPAMAKEQDNKTRVRELVKKSIHTSSYLVIPMMTGCKIL